MKDLDDWMDWEFDKNREVELPPAQHNAHVEKARWSRHDAHWQEWDWRRRQKRYGELGLTLVRPSYAPVEELQVQPMSPPVALSFLHSMGAYVEEPKHDAHVKAWIMKPWPFRHIGELPIMKVLTDDVFPLPLTVKVKSLGEK